MLSDITTLLDPERTLFVQELESKKRVFDTLAELLSHKQPQLDQGTIFDYLIDREKLGSTTIGGGISLPRARVPITCLLYTSPSPRDKRQSRMPSSA